MRIFFFLLFFLSISPQFAQELEFNLRKFHKNFSEFDDNLQICDYETSNFWYQQFLKDSTHLRPDSSAWLDVDLTGVMNALYHNHSNYYDHPVVNITQDEAEKYCEWLTIQYHQEKRRKYEKVIFRLPTKTEWKNAAYLKVPVKATYPFKKDPYHLKDKKNRLKAHFKYVDQACIKEENGDIINACDDDGVVWFNAQNDEGTIIIDGAQSDLTVPVYEYSQNKDMCNLVGNVYEITTDGMVGGSYNTTGYYLTKHAIIDTYELPHPEVGFRILMEVIEK